jgi:hypothetical protein
MRIRHRLYPIGFTLLFTLLLAAVAASVFACNSGNSGSAPEKPAATLLTGRQAFQQLYTASRLWATDSQPVILQSEPYEKYSTLDGKSPIWRATFVSASRRQQIEYLYVGVDLEDGLGLGVRKGRPSEWSSDSSEQPFNIAFIKTDSDQAFKVAQKNGGGAFLKRQKDAHVFYVLRRETTDGAPNVVWVVMYGTSPDTAPLSFHIESATGRLL